MLGFHFSIPTWVVLLLIILARCAYWCMAKLDMAILVSRYGKTHRCLCENEKIVRLATKLHTRQELCARIDIDELCENLAYYRSFVHTRQQIVSQLELLNSSTEDSPEQQSVMLYLQQESKRLTHNIDLFSSVADYCPELFFLLLGKAQIPEARIVLDYLIDTLSIRDWCNFSRTNHACHYVVAQVREMYSVCACDACKGRSMLSIKRDNRL